MDGKFMAYPELERCIQVVKALRHPVTGCPWDLEQTHQTLLKYLIEESYEFVEAVESGSPKLMEEEIMNGTQLFVIDHLHYFVFSDTDRLDLQIKNVMHDLNEIARKYNVAIIIIAHYRNTT